MVRLSECSSYRGFELSSDIYEKVLLKVEREFKSSSSYRESTVYPAADVKPDEN